MYTLLEEGRYEYRGYFGSEAVCGMLIYAPDNPLHPHYVVATELPDNPGTSITNAVEFLANRVFDYLERPRGGMVWIEHYPDRWPVARESFSIVQFDKKHGKFVRPRWNPTNPEVLRFMTGVSL